MLLKFRLEMNVIIDQNSETAVIELARQHYRREGGVTAPDHQGRPNRIIPAEKFIETTDQALLELLEHHPLLPEAGVEIERLSCKPVASLPETARMGIGSGNNASVQPNSSSEGSVETDEEEDLDDFESGLYLCRWPNGDFSIIKAESRREAVFELDEWAGAEPDWLGWLRPSLRCRLGRALPTIPSISMANLQDPSQRSILCWRCVSFSVTSSNL
jgi:hypothetical protein